MIKKALYFSLLYSLLTIASYAQDKKPAPGQTASPTKTAEVTNSDKVMKGTTGMSEKASQKADILLNEAGILKTMWAAPITKIELSEELKALQQQRQKVIDDLNEADKAMNALISKSIIWDKERNTEKKGHLDTILDKADRLAFSNELRMSMSSQAKTISSLISKLNLVEANIYKQKISDEKKRQTEALRLRVKLLEKEQKILLDKIKDQQSDDPAIQSTQTVQKKREENVEYYTITEDTNLQTIALSYYQDHEKWLVIFEHPDNKKVLKKKSPTAIIAIGTVLTIPKETQE